MATLAKQSIVLAGLTPTFGAAAAGGDKVDVRSAPDSGARTFLVVKNAGGSPIDVTIDDPNTQTPVAAQTFNPDVKVTVPATTGEKWIGPLSDGRFTNSSDGLIAITYSGVTSVTVAVVTLP